VEVERAVSALPQPRRTGLTPIRLVIRAMVDEAVADDPQPQDGRDADPAVIERMVADAVTRSDEAGCRVYPRHGDGADADMAALERQVEMMVERSVAAIPAPQDGRDADPAVIAEMVAAAVASIPAPKDGRDADPAEIEAMVERAVSALPPPKDGARRRSGS
jgi:hypothetical protein